MAFLLHRRNRTEETACALYRRRTRNMSDEGPEEKINTQLRDLTKQVRALRQELRSSLRRSESKTTIGAWDVVSRANDEPPPGKKS
jgi:hypothetical protein